MKTLVIGGGPAGMISAYFRAKKGDEVVLVERNEKLGKKLYITGKGRCNVTNDCERGEFLEKVVTNPKFLTGAVMRFSPSDFMSFLEKKVRLKVERGNRVFPVSDKASDITKCLESYLSDEKVAVRLNERVLSLEKTSDGFTAHTEKGKICCDEVIICTGGKSYPTTGSTGDGYAFAESLGHSVTPVVPALCGIDVKDDVTSLAGVSLKNVRISVTENGKEIFGEFGEMLFTHTGVSGPIVLTASSFINKRDVSTLKISLDLKPALSEKQLGDRVLRDLSKNRGKLVKNSLGELLIKSLVPIVIASSGIDAEKSCDEFTKEERQRFVHTVKNLTFTPKRLRPLEEAIVTSGGITTSEINPKTMESKIVKGLYFAGEVIDVDALTGGFNITIAATTAYSAGGRGEN